MAERSRSGAALARRRPAKSGLAIWATLALMAAGFGGRQGEEAPGGRKADAKPLESDREHANTSRHRAVEPQRGRMANAPSEIPPRGWKDILLRVRDAISEDRVIAIAAGITFYALLAIFPGIAALVALYGLFADPGTIAEHVKMVSGFVPAGGIEIINEQLQRVAAQGERTLGFAFFFGLGISLWSANSGTKALFDALNIVYNEKEERSFVKLNAMSLSFTIGAIVFLLLAIGALIVLPVALRYVGLDRALENVVSIGRWPVMCLVIGIAMAVLYRYGPSREEAKWRWVSWGSAFAAIMWVVASILFSWYATNFGSYNETYGSLGAVIGFMMWIWLSAIVILVGAELDAEMEHQTARDTTTGRPRPLGARGAHMADTVGAARG